MQVVPMGRLVRLGPSWPERMGGAAQPGKLLKLTHTNKNNFKKLKSIHAYKLESFKTQYFIRIYFIAKINTKEYKAQSSERF